MKKVNMSVNLANGRNGSAAILEKRTKLSHLKGGAVFLSLHIVICHLFDKQTNSNPNGQLGGHPLVYGGNNHCWPPSALTWKLAIFNI